MADWVGPASELDRLRLGEGPEAKRLAEEVQDEALGEGLRVGPLLPPRPEIGPVCLRNAPIAANLVTEGEPLWDAVVVLSLVRSLELGDIREPLRGEKAALNRERFEDELSLSCANLAAGGHGQATRGSSTNRPMTSAGSSAFTEYLPVPSPASRTRRWSARSTSARR